MAYRFIRFGVPAAAYLLGISLSAAFAQQTSPLSPTPAVPTATAPGEPSAAAVALGREVVVASGISRSFDIVVPQFLDQIGTTITQTRPDLIRDLNDVMEKIKPEFDRQTQELIDSAAKTFAQRLNEKQLKDIADFYKSPAGVAYVQAQPLVMADIVPRMQSFTQRLATDMMTRVRAEMKTRGHTL